MKGSILFILFFCPFFLFSQDRIDTDRPDQTESPTVIQPGSVQIETGAVYSSDRSEESGIIQEVASFDAPTTLIRIGIFKSAEFRLEAGDYLKEKNKINGTGIDTSITTEGFQPIVIGTKIAICEEKGLLPQTSFLGHLELPIGEKKFITGNDIIPSFLFSFSNTLSSKISLGYNLGLEWADGSFEPNYVYTLSSAFQLTPKMGAFVETYGNFSQANYPESYIDLGTTYCILNNLQIDISGGFALNKNSADYFLSAGIAMRLPK